MTRLLLAAVALLGGPALAKGKPLPSYPHALRCAALTEAAAKQVEPNSAEERLRFDRALYWGLAASEVARKAGLTSARFKQDQEEAGAAASAELAAPSAQAETELATCARQVPRLRRS
ncbi:MAG: hypothetical protein JOZ90_16570 [Alphaproteobacteria bacterium]|nr:hypothetical protein [Alphaproteobacteria bacterium]MBV9371574.1 hypothetical protein [Alphaproteobacteria bacterium]MBV9902684.1 hypothetical protein [Alphaproteobacteria bacterium]